MDPIDQAFLENVARGSYEAYCAAVGGKAFNGDPLPTWDVFKHDQNKQKQVEAWRAVARHCIELARTSAYFSRGTISSRNVPKCPYCETGYIDGANAACAKCREKATEVFKRAGRTGGWRKSQ